MCGSVSSGAGCAGARKTRRAFADYAKQWKLAHDLSALFTSLGGMDPDLAAALSHHLVFRQGVRSLQELSMCDLDKELSGQCSSGAVAQIRLSLTALYHQQQQEYSESQVAEAQQQQQQQQQMPGAG